MDAVTCPRLWCLPIPSSFPARGIGDGRDSRRFCRHSTRADELQAAPFGARPVDDGWLRGWRERSRNSVFHGGRLRGRRPKQGSRIAPKAATTRCMANASAVRKAAACKARRGSDDTGHHQHRCKNALHGRSLALLSLPHVRNLIIQQEKTLSVLPRLDRPCGLRTYRHCAHPAPGQETAIDEGLHAGRGHGDLRGGIYRPTS
jgi:hypothetical protein